MIHQCRNCGHLFAVGKLTPEQLTEMYSNYYSRTQFDVETYKPYKEKGRFLHWLDGEDGHAFRHVPPNVRVLDIGCGYCETLGYHKSRGCEVYGVEADENAKRIELPNAMGFTSTTVFSMRRNMNRSFSIM